MSLLIDIFVQVRDTFNDHVIFGVGILLVIGYFTGRLAERVRLPAISGYLLCGILLGDSLTGIIHTEMTASLRTITDVALGIIAITIGSEFSLPKLRRLGSNIVVITFVQLIATFFAVTAVLALMGLAMPYAMVLGAIASATAPAATVVIIQQLRARGDFVDTLYGVVALDDAACILLFAAVFAFAGNTLMAAGDAAVSSFHIIGHAVTEIVFSLILGAVEGVLIHIFTFKTRRRNDLLIVSLGAILLFTAVSLALELSPLLTNMAAGAVLVNIPNRSINTLRALNPLTPPLYAAFFAVAGTEFQLDVISNWGILALACAFFIARAVGKYTGVWAGARMVKAPPGTRNYLGLAMLPQAGAAIGLVLFIQASPLVANATPEIKEAFSQVTNIVLFAVVLNAFIGPVLSKIAVVKGADL